MTEEEKLPTAVIVQKWGGEYSYKTCSWYDRGRIKKGDELVRREDVEENQRRYGERLHRAKRLLKNPEKDDGTAIHIIRSVMREDLGYKQEEVKQSE